MNIIIQAALIRLGLSMFVYRCVCVCVFVACSIVRLFVRLLACNGGRGEGQSLFLQSFFFFFFVADR